MPRRVFVSARLFLYSQTRSGIDDDHANDGALVCKGSFAFNLSAVVPATCRLTITKASLMFRREIHSSFYDEAVFSR